MRLILLILASIILFGELSFGQISQGGKPLEFPELKSGNVQLVEMPLLNNETLLEQVLIEQDSEPVVKPFRFAHQFEVHLTTQNSGNWVSAGDGWQVWRLKILSKGAKSINLIFNDFNLPKEARLFLINEKENHLLGAFTSYNNKLSGKFAVLPVAGDELTIQYEVPTKNSGDSDFVISKVNHDFVGIVKSDDRRPLGKIAGECNIDINCDLAKGWGKEKDAVCRLIVDGREICTGTLVNNTSENQKPYILSAAHCYDKWEFAETTIYAFNYESPFCAPLDGDPSHSISGAVMKAQFDSLDFALAEMSLEPPPVFRPYFAGWDRSGNLSDSTVSIHHPQGDIKKIAIDNHSPLLSDFNSSYIDNGFIKILRWDAGVTEAGSSGGPLFNNKKNIIGTLTGGAATCSNPVNDFFARFEMAWDYRSDSAKQLKYWLDPINIDIQSLNGERFNTGEKFCQAFTNLNNEDEHQIVFLISSDVFSGYWGGTNSIGITEFVERFSIYGNEQLYGISMGVGKVVDDIGLGGSEIKVKIYNGTEFPETEIYSEIVKINTLVNDAMNFIGFSQVVEPADTFFVGFELSSVQQQDTFAVYQSIRQASKENYSYFKQDKQWFNFKESNSNNYSISNVFELIACNVDENIVDTPLVNNPLEILVYPNPTNAAFTLESGQQVFSENISVFNLLGKSVAVKMENTSLKKVLIDLSGNVPGVYFVRFNNGENYVTKKVSFVPW